MRFPDFVFFIIFLMMALTIEMYLKCEFKDHSIMSKWENLQNLRVSKFWCSSLYIDDCLYGNVMSSKNEIFVVFLGSTYQLKELVFQVCLFL